MSYDFSFDEYTFILIFEQLLKVKPFIDWTASILTEEQLEIVFLQSTLDTAYSLCCDFCLLTKSPKALRVKII